MANEAVWILSFKPLIVIRVAPACENDRADVIEAIEAFARTRAAFVIEEGAVDEKLSGVYVSGHEGGSETHRPSGCCQVRSSFSERFQHARSYHVIRGEISRLCRRGHLRIQEASERDLEF